VLPEPFPDRGPDEEPDDSPPQPSFQGEEGDQPEQGLFVCLPAEELTLAGFAEDGRADTMPPGPLLATVVDAVTGDDARGLAIVTTCGPCKHQQRRLSQLRILLRLLAGY
jgi:hypothetical protein